MDTGVETTKVVGWVWYRGGSFRGFQIQPLGPTVQANLMEGLQALGLAAIKPMPAGRTDLGVHARMQCVSFRVPASWELEPLTRDWNAAFKSPDVGVAQVRKAPPGFHAQWQAEAKEYRYRLALGPCPRPWQPYVWNPHEEPRLQAFPLPKPEHILEILADCLGSHDFIAFHENSSVRKQRHIDSAQLVEWAPGLFDIRFRGNSFARYQVRYLVGSAVATAMGLFSREQFRSAIEEGLTFPGIKAPAQGLTLWEIFYPKALDPFPLEDRRDGPGVPEGAPFSSALLL